MSNEWVNAILWSNVVVFGLLTIIWNGQDRLNLTAKALLLALTVGNALLALQ